MLEDFSTQFSPLYPYTEVLSLLIKHPVYTGERASKLACSNREQAMRNDEPRAATSDTPSRTAEATR